jgi:cation diffusion facilitator family transporter
MRVGKRVNSQALKANAWHHRTDSLSSIGVALAISVSIYKPEWVIMDSIAAFAVGIFIIQAAMTILNPAVKELSDQGASKEQVELIKKIVLKVEGVKSVHALRSRYLGNGLQVDLHVQVNGKLSVEKGHEIAGHAKRHLLEDGPEIVDVLIHIEPFES